MAKGQPLPPGSPLQLRGLQRAGHSPNWAIARSLRGGAGHFTATDAAVALGDNDALTELVADRSAYLVDRAKAETLHLWEDDDRAATLMERWV